MEEQKIFNIASIASIYILGRNATVVGILTKPHKVPTQSHRHTKYVTSILHKSKWRETTQFRFEPNSDKMEATPKYNTRINPIKYMIDNYKEK